jgi:hypothetical protein
VSEIQAWMDGWWSKRHALVDMTGQALQTGYDDCNNETDG